MRTRVAIGLSCALVLGAALAWPLGGARLEGLAPAAASAAAPHERVAAERAAASSLYPSVAQVRAARRYAHKRAGPVSFAVLGAGGGLRGLGGNRRYGSASVTKAMLLAGFLQQHKDSAIADSDKAVLGSMIRVSDNNAADAIYSKVGDGGLRNVAHRAGMRNFSVSGHWGGAQITANDMARFFFRLESSVPQRHRGYALGLLASVVPAQRWGIPRGAHGWRVNFKGGWRPEGGGWLTHQAALVRRGNARLGLAVMTNRQPSMGYATATIRGIAHRLLHPLPRGA